MVMRRSIGHGPLLWILLLMVVLMWLKVVFV